MYNNNEAILIQKDILLNTLPQCKGIIFLDLTQWNAEMCKIRGWLQV